MPAAAPKKAAQPGADLFDFGGGGGSGSGSAAAAAAPGDEGSVAGLKDLGNACFKVGKIEEAIGYYTRAIELSGDSPNQVCVMCFICMIGFLELFVLEITSFFFFFLLS